MKGLSAWVPDRYFVVGVLATLVLATLLIRQFSGNATVQKFKGYLGLAV